VCISVCGRKTIGGCGHIGSTTNVSATTIIVASFVVSCYIAKKQYWFWKHVGTSPGCLHLKCLGYHLITFLFKIWRMNTKEGHYITFFQRVWNSSLFFLGGWGRGIDTLVLVEGHHLHFLEISLIILPKVGESFTTSSIGFKIRNYLVR